MGTSHVPACRSAIERRPVLAGENGSGEAYIDVVPERRRLRKRRATTESGACYATWAPDGSGATSAAQNADGIDQIAGASLDADDDVVARARQLERRARRLTRPIGAARAP